MEEQEIEVIELGMNNEDIDEMIENLTKLKESKDKVYLDIAEDLSLLINYLGDDNND